MATAWMKYELKIERKNGTVNMKAGKWYRATYWTGKILEFVFAGSPTYGLPSAYCNKAMVSRDGGKTWQHVGGSICTGIGYCTEAISDWKLVEEVA